ncbi:MAG: ORF1 protein [Thetatorquevirus procy5]|uniref:Capsid protein n=1 Tax=Anelloviridae sp. TaxID=2055263 RepID=A0A3G2YSV6_9VIRU|nr:MAG: ORF1 protein [Anelloviridae sp.]AYP28722.1 MAG: ORF1 protein [Anelloviridae sp.]
MPFFRRRQWPRRWRRVARRYRRPLQSGFQRRGWTRRRRPLRAKVRRRLYYKRKRRVRTVLQWQPSHRGRCKIKGWMPMMWGYMRNSHHAFQYWNDPKERQPGHFTIMGGGAALHHFTLSLFYDEYLKRRNIWTRSNDGFDLAKYHGTKITLWPHEDLTYLFWWESDFLQITPTQYQLLHPAIAMNRRNHKIILSRKLGNRRKTRVFIQPPSTMTSTWAFMTKWCDIPLFRMGFTLCNLYDPFMHATISTGVVMGTTLKNSGTQYLKNPDIPPKKTPTVTRENNRYYKWWWDSGGDNKIATVLKTTINNVDETPNDENKIYHTEYPYWLTFFGADDDYVDPQKYHVFIWWYDDDNTYEDVWDIPTADRVKSWRG